MGLLLLLGRLTAALAVSKAATAGHSRTIRLVGDHPPTTAAHLVVEYEGRHAQQAVGPLPYRLAVPVRPADAKGQRPAVRARRRHQLRELVAAQLRRGSAGAGDVGLSGKGGARKAAPRGPCARR